MSELPSYLKYSHCCLIPFLCNELTKSIYPLKINEYLAAGKPVVSTHFSSDIASFSDVAYISDNHQEFVSNIDQAIADDNEQRVIQRVNFSSGNTWEARALDFIKLTSQYLGEEGKIRRKARRKTGFQPLSHR